MLRKFARFELARYLLNIQQFIVLYYLNQDLNNGKKYPFEKIINCNIGNPQQLGQKPISFYREVRFYCCIYLVGDPYIVIQVCALLETPELLQENRLDETQKLYSLDAVKRARALHNSVGNIGAYSHSQGLFYNVHYITFCT